MSFSISLKPLLVIPVVALHYNNSNVLHNFLWLYLQFGYNFSSLTYSLVFLTFSLSSDIVFFFIIQHLC
jgi:hypothetical protein